MQPHDPYNNPDQGGQYPSGPYPPQGGAHPSGGYPQPPGHGPSGGYPPPYGQPGGMPPGPPPAGPAATDPGAAKMPGTVITVRVFMFIGGIVGLLLGGISLFAGLVLAGDPEVVRAVEDAGEIPAGSVHPDQVSGLMMALGAIPLVYGVASTLLASFMGKRKSGILWGIVVFHVIASLLLILSFLSGEPGSVIPLVFTIGLIAMMLSSGARAFYKPVQQGPAPYGYGPGPQY